MKIEAGKRYVRRDGKVTGVIAARDAEYYCFEDSEGYQTYTENGSCIRDGKVSPYDLVSEYVEPDSPKAIHLEAGKRYVMRNGDVSGVIWHRPESSVYCYEDGEKYQTYTADGFFILDGKESQFDLVSEYVEPSEPSAGGNTVPIKITDLAVNAVKESIAEKADMVNHPPHYTSHPSGIECIQITEHMGFNLGNATKYVWRADLKHDAIEDLRKAIWYIEREIAKREAGK